jgi:hypothetical protein
MHRLAIFAALGLTLVPASLIGQREAVTPFVVAVVFGSDLLPIGRFTGSEWTNTWPDSEEKDKPVPSLADVPVSWLAKPVPRVWTLWPHASAVKQTIAINGTRRDPGGCSVPITLTIGPPLTPPQTGSHPPAVAVDTGIPVEAIRSVGPGSAEFPALEAVIRRTFAAEASRTLAAVRGDAWYRTASAGVDLVSLPMKIEVLVRPVANRAPVIYYFEAEKESNMRAHLIGVEVRGWIQRTSDGRLTTFEASGRVYGDDSLGSSEPLALITLRGRAYWILAHHGYESAGFTIEQVSPGRTQRLASGDGGGC